MTFKVASWSHRLGTWLGYADDAHLPKLRVASSSLVRRSEMRRRRALRRATDRVQDWLTVTVGPSVAPVAAGEGASSASPAAPSARRLLPPTRGQGVGWTQPLTLASSGRNDATNGRAAWQTYTSPTATATASTSRWSSTFDCPDPLEAAAELNEVERQDRLIADKHRDGGPVCVRAEMSNRSGAAPSGSALPSADCGSYWGPQGTVGVQRRSFGAWRPNSAKGTPLRPYGFSWPRSARTGAGVPASQGRIRVASNGILAWLSQCPPSSQAEGREFEPRPPL